MGDINNEIIKETFREDSLASSEEGILASPSPLVLKSSCIKVEEVTTKSMLSRIDQSINLNDSLTLLDGFDSRSQKLRNHTGRTYRESPDKKSVISSENDIGKLRADVMKFMEK